MKKKESRRDGVSFLHHVGEIVKSFAFYQIGHFQFKNTKFERGKCVLIAKGGETIPYLSSKILFVVLVGDLTARSTASIECEGAGTLLLLP